MNIAVLADDQDVHAQLNVVASSCAGLVHVSRNLAELRRHLAENRCDLLVISLAELQPDAAKLMRDLHVLPSAQDTPVLLLASRHSEDDLVRTMEAGANDYLLLPLRHTELAFRARILLRRSDPQRFVPAAIVIGAFTFDPGSLRATNGSGSVELTRKEFELALLLFQNSGRPLSRAYVLDILWPDDADQQSRTLDTHVSRVRNKLRLRPEHGYRLSPVYGYGYLFEILKPDAKDGTDSRAMPV